MQRDNSKFIYKILIVVIILILGNSFFSTSTLIRLNELKQKELEIQKLAINSTKLNEIVRYSIAMCIYDNIEVGNKYQKAKSDLKNSIKMISSLSSAKELKEIVNSINNYNNALEKIEIEIIKHRRATSNEIIKEYEHYKSLFDVEMKRLLKYIEGSIAFDINSLNNILNLTIFISLISILIFTYIATFIFLRERLNNSILQYSEERFHKLMNNSNDAILVIDGDERVIDFNQKFLKLSKYNKSELFNISISELFHQDKEIKLAILSLIERGYSYGFESNLLRKDSKHIAIGVNISRLKYTSNSSAILIVIKDLTLQKEISKELQFNQKYIFAILNSQPNIVIVTNGKFIETANSQFFEFFDEFKTIDEFRIKYRCICSLFQKENGFITDMIDGVNWIDYILNTPNSVHKVLIKWKNKRYIFAINIKRLIFNDKVRDIVNFTDITLFELYQEKLEAEVLNKTEALQELNIKLKEQAQRDVLTKLYNRAKFEEVFEMAVDKFKNEQIIFSIIMIDIDFFKKINDTFGHLVGDVTLKAVSKIIEDSIDKEDYAFRWGGEEFIVIAIGKSLAMAKEIAKALRENIKKNRFETIESLTCSFGVSEFKGDLNEILKRADNALYIAKEKGRDRVESL